LNFLITAGPTREFIDPVRFLSNPSSGKMGFALAQAAANAGHVVTLISGPVALKEPEKVRFIRVVTAEEMHSAVITELEVADVLVMNAAVCDYRPSRLLKKKMKKRAESLTLELVPTVDILREIGTNKKGKFVVGFAAESDKLVENARQKLKAKNLDMIVANPVNIRGYGFESDKNAVTVIYKDGKVESFEGSKLKLGKILIDRIERQIESEA